MNKKEEKLKLLKPDSFSKEDPQNPKNLDIENILNNAREQRIKEKKHKKIIVNGKEQK